METDYTRPAGHVAQTRRGTSMTQVSKRVNKKVEHEEGNTSHHLITMQVIKFDLYPRKSVTWKQRDSARQ